jgi:hypothetical protein
MTDPQEMYFHEDEGVVSFHGSYVDLTYEPPIA